MILQFKAEFVPLILIGTKRITIRQDSKNRWKAGRMIHFAQNVRTKAQKQFASGTCTTTKDIEINCSLKMIRFDYKSLSPEGMVQLARIDGFESLDSFFEFFEKNYKLKNNIFFGKVIFFGNVKEVGDE